MSGGAVSDHKHIDMDSSPSRVQSKYNVPANPPYEINITIYGSLVAMKLPLHCHRNMRGIFYVSVLDFTEDLRYACFVAMKGIDGPNAFDISHFGIVVKENI